MRLFTEHADTPLERAAARIFRLPLTFAISCWTQHPRRFPSTWSSQLLTPWCWNWMTVIIQWLVKPSATPDFNLITPEGTEQGLTSRAALLLFSWSVHPWHCWAALGWRRDRDRTGPDWEKDRGGRSSRGKRWRLQKPEEWTALETEPKEKEAALSNRWSYSFACFFTPRSQKGCTMTPMSPKT